MSGASGTAGFAAAQPMQAMVKTMIASSVVLLELSIGIIRKVGINDKASPWLIGSKSNPTLAITRKEAAELAASKR